MAYNFLSLVNEVNRKVNEVELTSSNFAAAKGFYNVAKDSVNAAIREINQRHFEWPFNHAEEEEVLVVGQNRYGFPAIASTVDFDSFRIKENATFGNDTIRLKSITYEDYLANYVGQEYTSDTSVRGVPKFVAQAPSGEFLIAPAPDQAYEIVYEYYRVPVDLELYSDVPSVPERFKHVIVDGAMNHVYMFRGNEQSASMAASRFEEEMKRMRVILINRYNYVTSTFLPRRGSYSVAGPRVF